MSKLNTTLTTPKIKVHQNILNKTTFMSAHINKSEEILSPNTNIPMPAMQDSTFIPTIYQQVLGGITANRKKETDKGSILKKMEALIETNKCLQDKIDHMKEENKTLIQKTFLPPSAKIKFNKIADDFRAYKLAQKLLRQLWLSCSIEKKVRLFQKSHNKLPKLRKLCFEVLRRHSLIKMYISNCSMNYIKTNNILGRLSLNARLSKQTKVFILNKKMRNWSSLLLIINNKLQSNEKRMIAWKYCHKCIMHKAFYSIKQNVANKEIEWDTGVSKYNKSLTIKGFKALVLRITQLKNEQYTLISLIKIKREQHLMRKGLYFLHNYSSTKYQLKSSIFLFKSQNKIKNMHSYINIILDGMLLTKINNEKITHYRNTNELKWSQRFFRIIRRNIQLKKLFAAFTKKKQNILMSNIMNMLNRYNNKTKEKEMQISFLIRKRQTQKRRAILFVLYILSTTIKKEQIAQIKIVSHLREHTILHKCFNNFKMYSKFSQNRNMVETRLSQHRVYSAFSWIKKVCLFPLFIKKQRQYHVVHFSYKIIESLFISSLRIKTSTKSMSEKDELNNSNLLLRMQLDQKDLTINKLTDQIELISNKNEDKFLMERINVMEEEQLQLRQQLSEISSRHQEELETHYNQLQKAYQINEQYKRELDAKAKELKQLQGEKSYIDDYHSTSIRKYMGNEREHYPSSRSHLFDANNNTPYYEDNVDDKIKDLEIKKAKQ